MVVGQEGPLLGAQAHGQVRVRQHVGEAGREVGHKLVRDGAQCVLHLCWELPVMVFLQIPKVNRSDARSQTFTLVLLIDQRPHKILVLQLTNFFKS